MTATLSNSHPTHIDLQAPVKLYRISTKAPLGGVSFAENAIMALMGHLNLLSRGDS